jgi:hypothetical protein
MLVRWNRPAVERLDPARLARRRVRARRTIVAVTTVVGLAAGGVFVRNTWFPGYVGTSRTTTLAYGGCRNGVFLPFTTNGRQWWAGADPHATGQIRTSTVNPADRQISSDNRRATGVVRFTSPTHAVLTSDAGGTLNFNLQARNQSFATYCQSFPVGNSSL